MSFGGAQLLDRTSSMLLLRCFLHTILRIPNSGNDATDKYERGFFGKYSNGEEASGQIETAMDS